MFDAFVLFDCNIVAMLIFDQLFAAVVDWEFCGSG
jgi:hypothetical protein